MSICAAIITFTVISAKPLNETTNHFSRAKDSNHHTHSFAEPSLAHTEGQSDALRALTGKITSMEEEKALLEGRLQRLEQELSQSPASPNMRSSAGTAEERSRFKLNMLNAY